MSEKTLKTPYAVFLGDVDIPGFAKTGIGLVEWRREDCIGQLRLSDRTVDLGVPDLDVADLPGRAASLVVGSAPRGGDIPDHWIDSLCDAARKGVQIVSGMHVRLTEIAPLAEAAKEGGAELWDVRVPPEDIPIATGAKRSGKRVLMVGTDCVAGKKYTALAIAKELKARAIPSDFRATGQTGIVIAGHGVPIDSVVCDFTAGAAEVLSPDNEDDHWDVIEGQGSLFHPSYAGVSLGLLHGSQPDAIIMCHPATRKSILGLDDYALPSIPEAIARNLEAARLTNPNVVCVGVSVNSTGLSEEEKSDFLKAVEDQTGLPCVDPLVDGPGALIDRMLEAVQ